MKMGLSQRKLAAKFGINPGTREDGKAGGTSPGSFTASCLLKSSTLEGQESALLCSELRRIKPVL